VRHEQEALLRRLALADESTALALVCAEDAGAGPGPGLDAKQRALVQLASLIAVSSATASYQSCVSLALAAGATDDEVVAVLASVAPVVGTARVVAAAADLALSLGYDVDSALEHRDAPDRARVAPDVNTPPEAWPDGQAPTGR
jgi:alkylhydroperoxidase/carboxymuconolactone decarboxylase family protein YurZ